VSCGALRTDNFLRDNFDGAAPFWNRNTASSYMYTVQPKPLSAAKIQRKNTKERRLAIIAVLAGAWSQFPRQHKREIFFDYSFFMFIR
jgi:hypothetical protein